MKKTEFYKLPAWKYLSRYVLLFHCIKQGNGKFNDYLVRCSTSGESLPVNHKDMCAGHWIKVFDANSSNFSTALNWKNIMPQTRRENEQFSGRPNLMKDAIRQFHGEDTVSELMILKNRHQKLDPMFLSKVETHFKNELFKLTEIHGDPWKK